MRLLGASAKEVRGGAAAGDQQSAGDAHPGTNREKLLRPAVRSGKEAGRPSGKGTPETAPCGGETHAQGFLVLAGGVGTAAAGRRAEKGSAVCPETASLYGELSVGWTV